MMIFIGGGIEAQGRKTIVKRKRAGGTRAKKL
jgi:hypothetical protein